jgi:AraC-binding-like domain
LAGHGCGSQDGRDVVLRRGDLVLYDTTRPFRLALDGRFERTTLIFPRAALLRRIGATEPFIGRRIDGTTGVSGLLLPLMRELPEHLDIHRHRTGTGRRQFARLDRDGAAL